MHKALSAIAFPAPGANLEKRKGKQKSEQRQIEKKKNADDGEKEIYGKPW